MYHNIRARREAEGMKADVIIIGGGVIGTACACFLAERGANVLVLE